MKKMKQYFARKKSSDSVEMVPLSEMLLSLEDLREKILANARTIIREDLTRFFRTHGY